jgi:hypothetical protein
MFTNTIYTYTFRLSQYWEYALIGVSTKGSLKGSSDSIFEGLEISLVGRRQRRIAPSAWPTHFLRASSVASAHQQCPATPEVIQAGGRRVADFFLSVA